MHLFIIYYITHHYNDLLQGFSPDWCQYRYVGRVQKEYFIVCVSVVQFFLTSLNQIGTPNNTGLELLMNMFGGLGAGSFAVPNNPDG